MPAPGDPRPRGHARSAPVRSDQQPPRQRPPVVQRHRDVARALLLRRDLSAGQMGDAAFHGIDKGRVKEAVLQHVADRAFLDLGRIEDQVERPGPLARLALRGLDPQDRLRLVRQPAPQPQRRQQAARSQRQRIGAPVEARLGPGAGGPRVDDGDRQSR